MKTSLIRASVALILCLLWAPQVRAVDGVIEINQARATRGGVTEVDDPGFPVLLASTGSYRLTSDLTVDDADTSAIVISADWVTLDLNGFTLRGPNTWAGGNAACTADGSGFGITAPGTGVSIANGRVVGFGAAGVNLVSPVGRIERVITEQNCGAGFQLAGTVLVIDSTARLNSGDGFSAGADSRISNSVADLNRRGFVMASGAGTVERCVANASLFEGIRVTTSSIVRRNQVNNNATVGIYANIGSLLLDNVVNGHVTGIVGATQAAAQVGSGGNVVTYGPGSGGYFYVTQLYCSLDNTLKLCP